MNKIKLYDGSFPHQKSLTLGGDNQDLHPESFQWERGSCESTYAFFTDMVLDTAPARPGKKIAWLVEPPSLSETHYDKVLVLQDYFDYVLSFCKTYLPLFGEKGLYYPLGGAWIAKEDQAVWDKSKDVCIIVSEKTGAAGHRLRHSTVEYLAERMDIDVYGRGYKPFDRKADVLRPYRYAIIIESCNCADYFSEKLIDALSMGCVPIYCGCPDIEKYFNKTGILTFNNLKALEQILTQVASPYDYLMRLGAINENFDWCAQYQCAEDWIYKNYGFLFS